MNSLLRVVLNNSKIKIAVQSKHLTHNLPSFRQYSINQSSRYSRRFFDRNVVSAGTLRVLTKFNLPTSFLPSSKPFATLPDDDSGDRDGSDLPATVAVPEVWPHLPVIAIPKDPVFPRFLKIVEVSCAIHADYCITN